MPSAHAILWFLGMFIVLWALSLIGRGLWGDRARGRRRCPACAAAITAESSRSCVACGYEAPNERALLSPRRSWRMVAAGTALVPAGAGACYLGVVVWAWTHMNHDVGLSLTVWNSTGVALAAFGLVAIGWAIRGERSRGRRRCPRCWYDMGGSGLQCPECGNDARHASHLYRPRRRWKTAALASLLLVGAAVIQGVPRVRHGGWRAAVPTTVLIAGLPWLPDALATEADAKNDENWTLLGRVEADTAWRWQTKWLEARAHSLLDRARSAREVHRAVNFASGRLSRESLLRALLLGVHALGSSSNSERDAAVQCLDELDGFLTHSSERVRTAMAPEVPGLMRILDDDAQPTPVVWAAARVVCLAGPDAAPAVPRLLTLTARAGRLRGFGAIVPLRRLAGIAPSIKEQIVHALDDPDPAIAGVACSVLAVQSLCDDATAEHLLAVVRGSDDVRAVSAAYALSRALWKPDVVIPVVLDEIDGPHARRAALADNLWYYEEYLVPYLARLVEALDDPDPAVRSAIISTIAACSRGGRFDLARSPVFPIIEGMQRDPDPKVSLAATTAISESITYAPAPR